MTQKSVEAVASTVEEGVGAEDSVALAIQVSDSREFAAADVLGKSAVAVEACMTFAIGLFLLGKIIRDSLMNTCSL